NHIACQHCTFLDLLSAHGIVKPPIFHDPRLELLIERGMEFEKNYLDDLRSKGFSVEDGKDSGEIGMKRTEAAMRKGVDYIYQADLNDGIWFGRADILEKVNKPSKLGDWSYEVIDTKLAKNTKAGAILQISLYSNILSVIQGVMPECMHIVTPENGFTKQTYRVDHYSSYFRFVQKRLIAAVQKGTQNELTYPLPVEHCDVCRWWKYCDDRRRKDDHLSLVAGLSNMNIVEINKWDVHTLEQFGELP